VTVTVSNRFLKQSCSDFTSVTGALEVIYNVMRYKFTYLLTYSQHHAQQTAVLCSVQWIHERRRRYRPDYPINMSVGTR